MSVRRLSNIDKIPVQIRRAFRNAPEPKEWEETLWREVAARMVLDALGYTGLGSEPDDNDAAIRDAKRWFRGIPNREDPIIVFDYANMEHYFEEACELAVQEWDLTIIESRELPQDFKARTHFERKYLERGESCYNLILS